MWVWEISAPHALFNRSREDRHYYAGKCVQNMLKRIPADY